MLLRAIATALLVSACLAPHASAVCAPIPGADVLWQRPSLRFVLAGEVHGSAETPALYADLVCSAVNAGKRVVVALERPIEEQKAIDEIASGPAPLLAQPGWNMFDGRSSEAMLRLIQQADEWKRAKKIAAVAAFDAVGKGDTAAQRNAKMGDAMKAIGAAHPGAVVIALTGNLHASKKAIQRFGGYPFMAMFLPEDETVSLFIADKGGMTWMQSGDRCGARKNGSSKGDSRGITLGPDIVRMAGFDGVLATGLESTASPPARGAPSDGPCSAK